MYPTQIKEPRLSEESTTESSTSVSGDSEADRATDEDLGSTVPPGINLTGPWETEEEFMTFANTVPEIAGRYTDADPTFRDDNERVTPPIMLNYSPRKHDKDRPYGHGGGGNRSNFGFQGHGHSHGHHHGGRGYSNHGGHRSNPRQGGHHYNRNQRPFGSEVHAGGPSGAHHRHSDQREDGPRGQKRKSEEAFSQHDDRRSSRGRSGEAGHSRRPYWEDGKKDHQQK